MLRLVEFVHPKVGLALASMEFSQKKVVRMFHDFNDGDGGFKLLDSEFKVAHCSEFSGLVEVDIGKKVESLIRVSLVGLFILTHYFELVEDGDSVGLLQVPGRGYYAKNRQGVIIVEVGTESRYLWFLDELLFYRLEVSLVNQKLAEIASHQRSC